MNRVVSYTIGVTLALVLTLAAFALVYVHTQAPVALPTVMTITTILVLAMIQLAVQMVFFLHLGQQKDSQWNTAIFSFTFFGILVIVIASVWIMNHLNYNMTPAQINQYIQDQSSF